MTDHYFSKEQVSKPKLKLLTLQGRGVKGEFVVSSGVFSRSRLDSGSWLLVENAIIQPAWKVLDLGCGYGPVGILLAKAFPNADFLLSDVNLRAVELAAQNIKKNNLQNATARPSDGFESIPELFDAVLLNPPQTAGRNVCIRLIRESCCHLGTGGLFQMVARHNKGGQTLSKMMKETFGNLTTIARKGGYHVYVSEKNNPF